MYIKNGNVPHKRHTVFRKPDGSLYHEQLFGTEGFHGKSSLLYHIHPPTRIKRLGESINVQTVAAVERNIRPRKFMGWDTPSGGDFLESIRILFFNGDCKIGIAAPTAGTEGHFYKNGAADEILFVHKGSGTMHSLFGKLDFRKGDYIVIPRGTIYQMRFEDADNRLLYIESAHPVGFPGRYLNRFGQFQEHAPFCERDFRLPVHEEPRDEDGEFLIRVRKEDVLHDIYYANHPFDVVGWDGYHYPFIFSIYDFEPITGRVHQPPPVHQTFAAGGFVVCSFVPRLYDYHPEAIPAPYNHSNIDSEEILYYVDGDFMSRTGVKPGNLTLHPGGVPHGPHPGTVEKSIGARETEELAVMVDTFRPLQLTAEAMDIEDEDYYLSWNEKK